MEETFISLNRHLGSVLEFLQSDALEQELKVALHNHDEGALPSLKMAEITSKTIDLLHSIEQLIEPGHLVLADHFLGTSLSYIS